MARVVILALAALAVVALPDGRASLHQPKEGLDIPVDPRGVPDPLPHPEFMRRLLILRNIATPPKGGAAEPKEREVVRNRIREATEAGKKRKFTPKESVALAVDLLRFGQPAEAESALAGERHGFLPNITLAHIALANRQWAKAFDHLDIANSERLLPPAADLGLTPQQFAWQMKLNRGPLMKLVQSRWKEPKRSPEDEQRAAEDEKPDAIFPVDYAAKYRAYELIETIPADQQKTPTDLIGALGERTVWHALRGADLAEPIATVQQLVLWFPQDARLFWLLGELYAAAGQYQDAWAVLDQCTWSLQYGNRKLLRQHREFVSKPAEEQRKLSPSPDEQSLDLPSPPPETPDADKPPEPTPHVAFTMRAVWVYIGVVGAVAALVLVRSMLKRRKGGSG